MTRMLNDLDICNSCGVVISVHTRTIHWDFHSALLSRLGVMEGRIETLERERDDAIDARREELERG